ncbi:MAG: acid--CoA ligase, partial [Roseibium sp.]
MKAISETQAAEHHKDGTWSDATLDSLFKATASAHPDRLAIADAPDRADWTGGDPRRLTYAEADKEIDRLAAFYGAVGLTA